MKEITIKSKNEPWSAVEITDQIQKEIDIKNGLVLLYSPDPQVNVFVCEVDDVLPEDYHRTCKDLLRDGRPFIAEKGEEYAFNFLHTVEKLIPVKDGEINLGKIEQYKIQRIFLFDTTGAEERKLWMCNLEEK